MCEPPQTLVLVPCCLPARTVGLKKFETNLKPHQEHESCLGHWHWCHTAQLSEPLACEGTDKYLGLLLDGALERARTEL